MNYLLRQTEKEIPTGRDSCVSAFFRYNTGKESIMSQFSTTIRDERRKRNITQSVVANEMHISVSSLSRLENGAAVPTPEQIEEFAEYYGLTVAELIDRKAENEGVMEKAIAAFLKSREVLALIYIIILSLSYFIGTYGIPIACYGVYYAWEHHYHKIIIILNVLYVIDIFVGTILYCLYGIQVFPSGFWK